MLIVLFVIIESLSKTILKMLQIRTKQVVFQME